MKVGPALFFGSLKLVAGIAIVAVAALNANPAFANFTLLNRRFPLTEKTNLGHKIDLLRS
jgi:hypothetical protein